MKIKITVERPAWDPNPQKSSTNNSAWRRCVIVQFENQCFKWIPTYEHLSKIIAALVECEEWNKNEAKRRLENEIGM